MLKEEQFCYDRIVIVICTSYIGLASRALTQGRSNQGLFIGFNQLLGAASTQTLVEIHNNLLFIQMDKYETIVVLFYSALGDKQDPC